MFSPSKIKKKDMKKPASKVAEPAKIQPKSQFLFYKNLPPRDFSLMTLDLRLCNFLIQKFMSGLILMTLIHNYASMIHFLCQISMQLLFAHLGDSHLG